MLTCRKRLITFLGPRIVVFEAAAILGLPMPMLTAWAGALVLVGRRFQIGPNLTKPVFSSTGLPEGDGLSCLGMLIIDVLFHKWHVHFFPLCQPVSHVDDWDHPHHCTFHA